MKGNTVCVVGLGYVGLPLAIEFRKSGLDVIGFDVNKKRVDELKECVDRSNEVSCEDLKKYKLIITMDEKEISKADYIIVAVPTPLDEAKKPDMSFIESSSQIVGKNMKKSAIVVYESTVFPGLTEEVCIPILEKSSGMKCPADFKVGYSPERINPGDKQHTLDKITKIVSGIDEESLEEIAELYLNIIKAGVHRAPNIKTAEAAKVIENTQRDVNIALINEFSLIFEKMGLKTEDVIDAAGTKWNFHKYMPGLVGGHCIGVDPYYLISRAKEFGVTPKMMLTAREVNEYMPVHVAKIVISELAGRENARVLILGLTFKENLKDWRNSKIEDTIKTLTDTGITVLGFDPLLSDDEGNFKVERVDLETVKDIDCIILNVGHDQFKDIKLEELKKKMSSNPIIMDIKSFFDYKKAKELGFRYICL